MQKLTVAEIPSGGLARELQSYVVQVPPRARQKLVDTHVVFAAPKLRGDQFAVLRTQSLYSRDAGLLWDDADYLGIENSII